MDFEVYLIYLGNGLTIFSALYVIMKGDRLSGIILFIGFLAMFQAFLATTYAPNFISTKNCTGTLVGYYDCLPAWYKASMIAGQAGISFVAIGIFMLTKRLLVSKAQ